MSMAFHSSTTAMRTHDETHENIAYRCYSGTARKGNTVGQLHKSAHFTVVFLWYSAPVLNSFFLCTSKFIAVHKCLNVSTLGACRGLYIFFILLNNYAFVFLFSLSLALRQSHLNELYVLGLKLITLIDKIIYRFIVGKIIISVSPTCKFKLSKINYDIFQWPTLTNMTCNMCLCCAQTSASAWHSSEDS